MAKIIKRKERGGVYYTDFTVNGRRIKRKLCTNLNTAKRMAAEIESNLLGGRHGDQCVGCDFDRAKARYIEHLGGRLQQVTIVKIACGLRMIQQHCQFRNVKEVTLVRIEEFLDGQLNDKRTGRKIKGRISGRTLNSYISSMNGFMRACVRWGYLINNPLEKVHRLKEVTKREKRALSEDEVFLLLEQCSPHLRAIVEGMLYSGMRRSEATFLTWDEVDLKGGMIKLKRAKNGLVDIPISPEMRMVLERQYFGRKTDLVFPNKLGRPYINNLVRDLRTALRKAGISEDDLDVHSLRRTFVTQHILKGTSPKLLQMLARHSHFGVTMDIYAKICDADVREAAQITLFRTPVVPREKVVTQLKVV